MLDTQTLYELSDGLVFMQSIDVQPELGLQPHHLCKIVGNPRHLTHIKLESSSTHCVLFLVFLLEQCNGGMGFCCKLLVLFGDFAENSVYCIGEWLWVWKLAEPFC